MAKKTVGKTQKSKDTVKLIRTVKNPKTGAYSFTEEMVDKANVKEQLNKK